MNGERFRFAPGSIRLVPLVVLSVSWIGFSSVDVAQAGLIVPNTFGQGADASLGNDSVVLGTSNGGAGTAMEIRANDAATNRNRLGIVRFDVSQVNGDTTGAILKLYETGNNSRTVTIYGLNDGDAGESWGEGTITYDTAPAISLIVGPPPATAFDALRTTLLGTLNTTGSTTEYLSFSSATLDTFLAADTNGLATFYLYRDGGGAVTFRTKEFNYTGTVGNVPTLELPNIPEPSALVLLIGGLAAGAALRGRR